MLKETALSGVHKTLGAKMVEFAGYLMPLYYQEISIEHASVRNHVGLFDVSHMGEFIVSGSQSTELVSHVTSNDPTKLIVGQAQYAYLPNESGGIVDDLLVYRLRDGNDGQRSYMLVVNASNIDKDYRWILNHNDFEATCHNISDSLSLLALQGPDANPLLQELVPELIELKYYHFDRYAVAGISDILVSATGYTGSGGYELYIPYEHTEHIWSAIYQLLPKYAGLPIGLGARDTLRLEKGYCLYGNDIDDTTSPLEAGLGWVTKLKKKSFVGKEAILSLKEEGNQKDLIGFRVLDRRVARPGYKILDDQSNPIGRVTSGCISPSLQYPIGLGYVDHNYKAVDTTILIDTGRKIIKAQIVKLPFV